MVTNCDNKLKGDMMTNRDNKLKGDIWYPIVTTS